jgi:tetratricopeptide (TPR) repeat protein
MNEEKSRSWLIRDNTNVIRGPYSQTEVANLIKKGQLKGKTEVACANSYWFALDEKAEVAKFFPELNLKVAEQPTQMTATLTQADVSDHVMEATQVIQAPKPAEPEPGGEGEGIQWLSDEFADEFGEDAPGEAEAAGALPAAEGAEGDNVNTQEMVINDLLNRSSVKNDTLPSERRDFKGDKPTPINSLIKAKDRGQQPQNMVQVPVGRHETGGKILPAAEEPAPAAPGNNRNKLLLVAAGLVIVGAGIALASGVLKRGSTPSAKTAADISQKRFLAPLEAVRRSLLLFDLEEAKSGISELELQAESKGSVVLPMAQALLKKEFLYDTDGAFMALQTARSLAKDKSAEAEVDNLMAVYRFEKDRSDALDDLRRVAEASPDVSVFRYNYALGHLRAGHARDAIAIASKGSVAASDPVAEDFSILLGWAREVQSKGSDPSIETAYQRALEVNPFSAKARLGLAIYRLRKGGMKASEMDFRAFIESLPELDPPSQVVNFRKMSDFEFYIFARAQLRDLNVPLGAAGAKPSPLVMAVDAVLSCLQSRTGEAGKILEVALTGAPGDSSILKAMGYHRFKEGRHAEVIELLKELARERSSFAVNMLVGKAQLKVGRRDEALKFFEQITAAEPSRSEGWSLLGDLQLQRGQGEEARKNLRNALQRNPGDILALRGLEQLGEAATSSPELAGNLPF